VAEETEVLGETPPSATLIPHWDTNPLPRTEVLNTTDVYFRP
jgi:hypothetical protein